MGLARSSAKFKRQPGIPMQAPCRPHGEPMRHHAKPHAALDMERGCILAAWPSYPEHRPWPQCNPFPVCRKSPPGIIKDPEEQRLGSGPVLSLPLPPVQTAMEPETWAKEAGSHLDIGTWLAKPCSCPYLLCRLPSRLRPGLRSRQPLLLLRQPPNTLVGHLVTDVSICCAITQSSG